MERRGKQMKMEIAKLRQLVSAMLSRLEDLGYDQEDVPWNRYWDTVGYKQGDEQIPERYNAEAFDSLCPTPRRGSLQNDWNDIKDIASKLPDVPVAPGATEAVQGELYKLVQVSNLLRALGDYFVWKNPHLLENVGTASGDNTRAHGGSTAR